MKTYHSKDKWNYPLTPREAYPVPPNNALENKKTLTLTEVKYIMELNMVLYGRW